MRGREAENTVKHRGFEQDLANYPIHSSIFGVDQKPAGRPQEAPGSLPEASRKPQGVSRKPQEPPEGHRRPPGGLRRPQEVSNHWYL